MLILEDEDKRGREVSGQYLGALLHDQRTLRLAVLNACEGARSSSDEVFSGTAQSLVQQGLPAVIAMQFEVTDTAAITLTHEFCEAIADGYPVDAALAEARKAIFAQGNDVEWGTPVLYMRSPDGRIFDIDPAQQSIPVAQPAPAAPISLKISTPFFSFNLRAHAYKPHHFIVAAAIVMLILALAAVWYFNDNDESAAISTLPAGATAFLNGDSIGVTPIRTYRLNPGLVPLRLQKPDFFPLDTLLKIEKGGDSIFAFILRPQPRERISIQINLDDARVKIDGESKELNSLSDLLLTVGWHQITISHPRYGTIENSFEVKAGLNPPFRFSFGDFATSLPQPQRAQRGKLRIASNPAGAAIFLNGQRLGTTPYEDPAAPAGRYRVEIVQPGYERFSQSISVQAGRAEEINVKLIATSATNESLAPTGKLIVLVQPAGKIFVDDKLLRDDDDKQFEIDLPVGPHQVRAVHSQYGEWEKSINIETADRQQLTINFGKMVRVTVAAEPVWGNIYIDGRATGYQTPRELELRVGKHTIEVRRENYILEGGARAINLEENLNEPLLFKLKRAP